MNNFFFTKKFWNFSLDIGGWVLTLTVMTVTVGIYQRNDLSL